MNAKKEYNSWHKSQHGAECGNLILLKQWHEDALNVAPALQNKAVLEVGCGAGDFCFELESRGATVVGLDFSDAAIEIANRKRAERASSVCFLVGDACSLPMANEAYDLVFSCECIEHVPDPQKAILEMARVLKPGGMLVVTTENYTNPIFLSWIQCWLTGRRFNSGVSIQPIEHFFIFPVVNQMIRRAKLRLVKTTTAHHVFLLLPGFHPHKFVVERFRHWIPRVIFKFLGRHWCFCARKDC